MTLVKETVSLVVEGRVGILILDKPPANGHEIAMLSKLYELVKQAGTSKKIKAVVLKSASDKFFSAGADIKVFGKNSTSANKEMVLLARKVCSAINNSGKIFIALIKGHALGGGLELAMACDIRIAAEGEYLIGLPEVTLGLMPGNGGTVRLINLIGASKAMELMIGGDPINPKEAFQFGLVNQLCSMDTIEEEVMQYAQKIAKGPSLSIANIKRLVNANIGLSLEDSLELEQHLVNQLYDTNDAAEGVQAFIEKRSPNFE